MGLFDFLRREQKEIIYDDNPPYTKERISQLMLPFFSSVVLVQSESHDSACLTLASCALVRTIIAKNIAEHHGLHHSRDSQLIGDLTAKRISTWCVCYSAHPHKEKIMQYCRDNGILFLESSPHSVRYVSKGNFLASALNRVVPFVVDVVLLLDSGVSITTGEGEKLLQNAMLEFFDQDVGLVLGRNRSGALFRSRCLQKPLNEDRRRYRHPAFSVGEAEDFAAFLHILEDGIEAYGYKVRYIDYLKFL